MMGILGIAIGLGAWLVYYAIEGGRPEHLWILVGIASVAALAWWLRPD
jgi:hypothetical protein